MGILFNDLVFGPLKSRRLGISLGVNLMPKAGKICSFDCIYCECGWNNAERDAHLTIPTKEAIEKALEQKLKELKGTTIEPESITFSGNGEPTLHPQFAEIVDIVIRLRDLYCPKAVISVLTNGTMTGNEKVFNALNKIENNIVKLDGGTKECIEAINLPNFKFDLEKYISRLKRFNCNLTIQTLFLRGEHNGKTIDNTTENEVNQWIEHLKVIRPKRVMMYVIERATPEENLEKISKTELEVIAEKVKSTGIETEIYT